MGTYWQDLRYALRVLWKSPGFTVVATIALALGIGANTAIFSVVNAVLIRPLAYHEPDRLVVVWEWNKNKGNQRNVVSPGNFLDWQAQNTVFDQMAAIRNAGATLTGVGEPEELRGQAVSWNLFPMLGVSAVQGRTFLAQEDLPRAPAVALLSHRLWQRRFGSDPAIAGRAITLSGNSVTVVGVMPPGFQFLNASADYWVPFQIEKSRDYRATSGRYMMAAARLKPGVSLERARGEMRSIAARLENEHAQFNKGWSANVVALEEQIAGDVRRPLYILLIAVALVLLIACANIANLLLARASGRRTEIAVRVSLGAGHWQVVRQLLTENLLLGALGGGVGLLLAVWGLDALLALAPKSIPRLDEVRIDGRVLGFTVALTFLTSLVFGLTPALLSVRTSLVNSLKAGGRSAGMSSAARRVADALVIVEVALSLFLLIGAGLLIRSFSALTAVDAGFQPDHLLTARVLLPGTRYPVPRRIAFFQQALARFEALPGVRSASAINFLPFGGDGSATKFDVQGRPPARPGEYLTADVRVVEPNYFRTLGIPIVRGRDFAARDSAEAPRVFLISQALARKYFPQEDPIGKRISVAMDDTNPFGEIVGIVGDIRDSALEREPTPTVYYPHPHLVYPFMTFVVRTAMDPAAAAGGITGVIRALDPNQPVAEVRLMDDVIANSLARRRFNMLLLAVFAGLALVLAAVGIYGVMSYAVTQRTQEIGVRMAIGAQQRDVLRMILRHALAIAAVGLALGVAGALLLTKAMAGLLYAVKPADPVTFAIVPGLLLAVAAAAAWLPARRAARVDPLVALRHE